MSWSWGWGGVGLLFGVGVWMDCLGVVRQDHQAVGGSVMNNFFGYFFMMLQTSELE